MVESAQIETSAADDKQQEELEIVENENDFDNDDQFFTDPSGVQQPRNSLCEQDYSNEDLRLMKQQFLTDKVINAGYDPTEFAQFLEYKMEGGTNVDYWEFQALMNAVDEF